MRQIRDRLTYANVMSTVAVFVALGGTSYAVATIDSGDIRDNTVRSRDVRDRTLTGSDVRANRLGGGAVKESALGKVPSAGNADRVGGATAEDLRVRCPAFTTAVAGMCVESFASAPDIHPTATFLCRLRNRQLVSYSVLRELARSTGSNPAVGGEWTADVFESRSVAGRLDAVVLTSGAGGAEFAPVFNPGTRAFRCMAAPAD